MTALAPLTGPGSTRNGVVDVDVVIPVYDEEAILEASVRRLHDYLTVAFPPTWTITIADNASRDQTWGIACRLSGELCGVRAIHLDTKGRGRALRAAWSTSTARLFAYTDVDLSTDLDGLLPLVAPLLSGHSDVAIGSRLATGARVVRGPKREVISRSYNLILRATLGSRFSDAQCGFKAVRAEVARALLPMIKDNGWFFDTELLTLAERNGLRIHEVPVDWVDNPDSRVDVVSTACEDLRGVARLMRSFAAGQGVVRPDSFRASRHVVTRRRGIPLLATVGAAAALAVAGVTSVAVALVVLLAVNALALLAPFLSRLGANRSLGSQGDPLPDGTAATISGGERPPMKPPGEPFPTTSHAVSAPRGPASPARL
jgi:glycosyltransferase involved in cell wall biosynthesis